MPKKRIALERERYVQELERKFFLQFGRLMTPEEMKLFLLVAEPKEKGKRKKEQPPKSKTF